MVSTEVQMIYKFNSYNSPLYCTGKEEKKGQIKRKYIIIIVALSHWMQGPINAIYWRAKLKIQSF